MSVSKPTETKDASLTRDVLAALRYYIGTRRAILILGVPALVGGLALNWSWLVAVGAAPIILSTLPCLVMCALGLCMHKVTGARSVPEENAPAAQLAPPHPQWTPRQTRMLSCCSGTDNADAASDSK